MLNILALRSAVIGLYTSYVTPIFLRITSGRNKFVPGPFSLGKWYLPIGVVAVSWVCFIVVLLVFPPGSHPAADTMSKPASSSRCAEEADFLLSDYAVVIVMAVFIFASTSWVFSARHWFTGPVSTVEKTFTEKGSMGRVD